MTGNDPGANLDRKVADAFGKEWKKFDQHGLAPAEELRLFESYFHIFPWTALPAGAVGFDLGCGSGRWAAHVAPRVGVLHCIDASAEALAVAAQRLTGLSNCQVHLASVDAIPLADASADFGYSLGVLHHVPQTEAGLGDCVKKLKPRAPFLLYLYYALDNRPLWFRAVWRCTDVVRRIISRLPFTLKALVCDAIALFVYWPIARAAKLLELCVIDPDGLPLASYRDRSFYVLRTDALDRFGTRLEQRFTRAEIAGMMSRQGLRDITFSETMPYWCAVGYKDENSDRG